MAPVEVLPTRHESLASMLALKKKKKKIYQLDYINIF